MSLPTAGSFSLSSLRNSVNSVFTGLQTDAITVGQLVPSANGNADLGSTNRRFRNVYLAGNTISFGNGLQLDSYDWSYLANYVIPPRVSASIDNTNVFDGVAQEHSAYVRNGEVYTFGRNNFGQLGHGDTNIRYMPVKVRGISGAAQVACGESFTVVVMANGTVKAFGLNANGQLGDGTTTNRTTPVDVPGITTATRVACGNNFMLLLLSNGTVVGFGSDALGQLGDGATNNAVNTSAVTMNLPSNTARYISCGAYHSIVLLDNGAAYACGDNSYGQLAVDPTLQSSAHTLGAIPNVSNVVSADCGHYHTVLVTYVGNVIIFGRNDRGQLGINTKTSYNAAPQTIITQGTSGSLGLSTLVGAGLNHTVVIRGDNSIFAFGANDKGQLGLGQTVSEVLVPTQLQGYMGYSIGCGTNHTVIRTQPDPLTYTGATGTLVAFGDNTFGQMGDNNSNVTIRWFPNRIHDGTFLKKLMKGCFSDGHSGYVDSDGVVYLHGANGNGGQLGNDTSPNSNDVLRPQAVSRFDKRIIELSGGYQFSLALNNNGEVWTWGAGDTGKLGTGTFANWSVPYNISSTGTLAGSQIVKVRGGGPHSAALDTQGRVHVWGSGGSGQLGNSSTSNVSVPIRVTGGTLVGKTIVDISFGNGFSLALDSIGKVHGWGVNTNYELGISNQVNQLVPIQITGGTLVGVTIGSIAAGTNNALVLDTQGRVHAWGYNPYGNIGNSSTSNVTVPIRVTGGSLVNKNITAISSGLYFSLALDSDGKVHAWGRNNNGQIGNSSTSNVLVPIMVTGGSLQGKTVIAIEGDTYTSRALDSEGNIHAWGWNNVGQVGDNTTINKLVPVLINTTTRTTHTKVLSEGAGFHKLMMNTGTSGSLLRAAGRNTNRQIGDNTTTDRYTQVNVTAFTSGTVVSAANSEFHSAVVLSDGTVYAWGKNDYGQCGTNSSGADVGTPTRVTQLSNAVEVMCGSDFTLVRNGDKTLYSFGRNDMGQLGISTSTVATSTSTPTLLTLTSIETMACGPKFAMAANSTGVVYAWGDNTYGKLGLSSNAAFTDTPTAVSLSSLDFAKVINIGLGEHHSILICNDRSVYSAGLNDRGQLGRSTNYGTTTGNTSFGLVSLAPYEMTPLKAACGDSHVVLHMANNQIMVWGNNDNNQAPASGTWEPTLIETVVDVMNVSASKNMTHIEYISDPKIQTFALSETFGRRSQIAVGVQHSLAINNDGSVYTWGYGQSGQRGDGTLQLTQGTPQNITNNGTLSGRTIMQVAGTVETSFFLDSTGILHACGNNRYGQLADGTNNPIYVPARATAGSLAGRTIVSIASNIQYNTLALDNGGIVHAWGRWAYGNGLGNSNSMTFGSPVRVTGGSLINRKVVAIATGSDFALALDTEGRVHGWGRNDYGQIGISSTSIVSVSIPIMITGGTLATNKIVSIGCNGLCSYAIDTSGRVHAWGYNGYYELGDGTNIQRTVPVLATAGSLMYRNFTKVLGSGGGGAFSTWALDTSRRIHAWGYNDTSYMLGNNTSSALTIPAYQGQLDGVRTVDIAAGQYFGAALTHTGTMYLWGRNNEGQLGTGNQSNYATPFQLSTGYMYSLTSSFTSGPIFVNFTGQHRCFVNGIPSLTLGDYEGLIVVADQNKYASLERPNKISINESLPLVSVSSTPKSKKSFGVISLSYNEENYLDSQQKQKLIEQGDVRIQINSIGEGAVWVCDINGSLESGDYITSSIIPGYGMKQDDDILRNYTVAKMTMDCDFTAPLIEAQQVKKDAYGNNVLDESGKPVLETIMETNTVQNEDGTETITVTPKMEPFYQIRYLDTSGNKLTKEEYDTRKENGEQVYKAAFVGCTYHCG